MRVLCVVHQADAGPGVFAPVLTHGDHVIDLWSPGRLRWPPAPSTSYDATLVFGGAMHVDQEAEHPWLRAEKALLAALVARGAPVLGVCLGAQLVAEVAGGRARPAPEPEIGWREVSLDPRAADDPLLGGLPSRFTALEWHSYEIEAPPGAAILARSDCCLQAFRADECTWGVQFHAEVTEDTLGEWVAKDGEHGELAGANIDPGLLAAETQRRIDDSNRMGAELCERFLSLAAGTADAAGQSPPRRAAQTGRS